MAPALSKDYEGDGKLGPLVAPKVYEVICFALTCVPSKRYVEGHPFAELFYNSMIISHFILSRMYLASRDVLIYSLNV
jgi:hypothetical protein